MITLFLLQSDGRFILSCDKYERWFHIVNVKYLAYVDEFLELRSRN